METAVHLKNLASILEASVGPTLSAKAAASKLKIKESQSTSNMATIAIRIDDDEPDRKEHTSCIDRWTDKGLALLTFFGGNGRAKSKAGVAWKYIARILAVLAGPTDTVTKLLDPCEEESCADSNNFDDLYVWPALFIFLNFALILIGVRRNKPENNQLIFDERVVNRGRVARTIRTVLVVIAVGQVLSIPLGAVEFGKYSDMKDAGKRVAATILNSMSEIGFMCMLANFFDGIGNAGAWLRATRKVVTRFANEVQAASDAANDLVPCPAAVEVMPIGENAGVGGAVAVSAEVSAVEIGTANDKQLAAQAKIKSSFGAAWRMVQTTNRIFVSYECGVCIFKRNAVVAQVSRFSFAHGSHPAFVFHLPGPSVVVHLRDVPLRRHQHVVRGGNRQPQRCRFCDDVHADSHRVAAVGQHDRRRILERAGKLAPARHLDEPAEGARARSGTGVCHVSPTHTAWV